MPRSAAVRSWLPLGSRAEAIVLLALIVLCAVIAGGCALPERAYVEADRATWTAIAPAHARAVLADPALDKGARAARLDVLDSWADRLATAEQALGIPVGPAAVDRGAAPAPSATAAPAPATPTARPAEAY